MLFIALSLLGGWILQLFGFDHTVITGMKEVFHLDISTTSYYFLFGAFGALKQFANSFNPNKSAFKFNDKEDKKPTINIKQKF